MFSVKECLVVTACSALLVGVINLPIKTDPDVPTYYPDPLKTTDPVWMYPDPYGQSASMKAGMLSRLTHPEAIVLVEQMSEETLVALQPSVVQLVRKLQSEGKDLEWAKNGAATLIAHFSPECTGLSPDAQKDFSSVLVETALGYGSLR